MIANDSGHALYDNYRAVAVANSERRHHLLIRSIPAKSMKPRFSLWERGFFVHRSLGSSIASPVFGPVPAGLRSAPIERG